MSEENKKLDEAKLEEVAGGNAGQFGPIDDVHNLAYFVPHKVCDLPQGTCLVMNGDSCQSGTRFLQYPDNGLALSGQRS